MFQEIFVKPILNLLVLIYNFLPVPDLGIAVIIVTILIRLLLYPLFGKATRAQMTMARLQPEVARIQKQLKNDRQAQTKALFELYRKHRFNPFSGMLLIFIQIPIIIALYQVFLRGVSAESLAPHLYAFVTSPGELHPMFLGMLNLTEPSMILAILAGIAQFLQTKYAMPLQGAATDKNSVQSMMAKQMLYFGPFLTTAILWKLASVIGLYWTLSSLLSIGQQYLYMRKENKGLSQNFGAQRTKF
jgi:YidC/Oxa1 family membrane protein insertase